MLAWLDLIFLLTVPVVKCHFQFVSMNRPIDTTDLGGRSPMPLMELFSYWNGPQEFNQMWSSDSLQSLNNLSNLVHLPSVIFKLFISRITRHCVARKHIFFFSAFNCCRILIILDFLFKPFDTPTSLQLVI